MVANENSGERKCKRVKARERERGAPFSDPPHFSSLARPPAARRTDPLTEGLEQAVFPENCKVDKIFFQLDTKESRKARYKNETGVKVWENVLEIKYNVV